MATPWLGLPLPDDFLRCWPTEPVPAPDADANREWLITVLISEARLRRQYGLLEMVLSARVRLGNSERMTGTSNGLTPRWHERLEFVFKKRDLPTTMKLQIEEIGLFKETTIAQGEMQMAPIYEYVSRRCVVPLIGNHGDAEGNITVTVSVQPYERRRPQVRSGSDNSYNSFLGTTIPIHPHAESNGAEAVRMSSDITRPSTTLQQDMVVEQINQMFPYFERDLIYELYIGCDCATDRVVSALLAMSDDGS